MAESIEYQQQISTWVDKIKSRYDRKALSERVLESQRRRKFLKNVMRDQGVMWDYQAIEQSEELYIRNAQPIYELEKSLVSLKFSVLA